MKIPNKLTRTVARQILIVQKQSPHILFGLGIVGVISGTVLACRATLKLADTLDDIKVDMEEVKKKAADPDYHPIHSHSKDMTRAYFNGTYDVVKLYAPAVIVGTAGIAALTKSHLILSRRNAALTAAYSVVSKAFDEYRDRVKKEVGEERELELYHGVTWENVTSEEGVEGSAKVVDPTKLSMYARFFDETSRNWQKNAELNRIFVQVQQNYLNDLLHARGHVFLNEVYDQLGLERSQAGQVVGWVISDDGDNYIDFGLYEVTSNRFVNGLERSILLDFNVDGVIWDKI